MSLTSDIAADWQYIEGVETVTLVPQNPDGAEVRNVKALMKATGGDSLQESSSFATDPSTVTWHLWEATLQGVVPKNGDLIRDRFGDVWLISSVGQSLRSGRFIVTVTEYA